MKSFTFFALLAVSAVLVFTACTGRGYGPGPHSLLFGTSQLAGTPPPRPVGDRDLGNGAGGEKLGELALKQKPQDLEDWRNAPMDPLTGERYAAPVDNPFMAVATAGGDASTFGLEVDTASYSNVRRWLKDGRLPPAGAVRIEDFLNTFTYAYAPPTATDERPLRPHVAVTSCPWAPEHRLVRIGLAGKILDRATRPPLNLVFLVDSSGSMMSANKLPLVQKSLEKLAKVLDERDTLAVVTYAGSSQVVLPATSGDHQDLIRDSLRGLSAGGSTNGAGGILSAYAEAAKGVRPGVQSRVVLCTDGDFNVGTTSLDALRALVEEKRRSGVYLTVYGFGMGNLKDETMEMLANKGNGTYGYIDDEREADRLLVAGAVGQLVTIAKDVKAQVFFNPATVAGWRLIGYENRVLRREDFNDDRIDAGEIGAGHTVTALYEVVPAGRPIPSVGPHSDPNPFTAATSAIPAGDRTTLLQLRLRWKAPDQDTSRLYEENVPDRLVDLDPDLATAAAVAGFGMLLRNSPYKGSTDWGMIERLGTIGLRQDGNGQRRAFLDLVGTAKGLSR